MRKAKKAYKRYTESERKSYICEYLNSPETKAHFCKRTGIFRENLYQWMKMYNIKDKQEVPASAKSSPVPEDVRLQALLEELSSLRSENRKLRESLSKESLRLKACETLIDLAESTYHIKVRKNSDAK